MNTKYSQISSNTGTNAGNIQLLVATGVNNRKTFLMHYYSELCNVLLTSAEATSSLQAGDAETF